MRTAGSVLQCKCCAGRCFCFTARSEERDDFFFGCFREDRVEEGIGGDYRALVRRELDAGGSLLSVWLRSCTVTKVQELFHGPGQARIVTEGKMRITTAKYVSVIMHNRKFEA